MRLLGLELGEHEIRVARGERAFGTVRLTGVERIPYDGAAELAERLAALAAPSTTVLTAIPATAVTQRLLVLPFRDPRRLARTLRLELFGQLPEEPEDALVAYESLGRVTEGSAVLAVVARQADIAAHRALLGPAGLSPLRIELAPLPAWNLLPPALADAGLLLADGTRSTLSIRRDGRIAGLRALVASADDPAALAAEARWSLAALGGIPSTLVVAGPDAAPGRTARRSAGRARGRPRRSQPPGGAARPGRPRRPPRPQHARASDARARPRRAGGRARGRPAPRADGQLRDGRRAPRGSRRLALAERGHRRGDTRRRRRAARRVPPARRAARRWRGDLVTARLTAWLMDLSRRERTLLAAAGALTIGVVVLAAAFAVRDDLAALRARVAGREREHGAVRRLAARLHQEEGASSSPPDSALLT